MRRSSDENGCSEIHLPPDVHTGGASFLNITRYQVPTQVTPCWTLDELMSMFSVDGDCVVKIDVEGFEREVVGGSIGRFQDGSISSVILETHPTLLESRARRKHLPGGERDACKLVAGPVLEGWHWCSDW